MVWNPRLVKLLNFHPLILTPRDEAMGVKDLELVTVVLAVKALGTLLIIIQRLSASWELSN